MAPSATAAVLACGADGPTVDRGPSAAAGARLVEAPGGVALVSGIPLPRAPLAASIAGYPWVGAR